MTPRMYLRRVPRERPRSNIRFLVAVAALLLTFALLETSGNATMTRLTHDIQQTRLRIRQLQGEISYEVGNDVARGHLTQAALFDESFSAPDSGHLRTIAVLDADGTHGGRGADGRP